MIPVEIEPKDVQKEWPRIIERCAFCKKETRYWHKGTNNPVCPDCAKKHKVGELKN